MTITKTQRAAVIEYVRSETNYDASTVRISRDGVVSAVLDADKTFNGPHTTRIDLGTVADLLRAD